MRVDILRFYDELIEQKKHGKEYFNEMIDVIAEYNKYCQSHPNFPNGKTTIAS